ncbi:MAG: hypothetical protein MR971_02475, partial [Bacteroidales bacterium]|nr:hypothetical protein [Bacteroidales bacterium]
SACLPKLFITPVAIKIGAKKGGLDGLPFCPFVENNLPTFFPFLTFQLRAKGLRGFKCKS